MSAEHRLAAVVFDVLGTVVDEPAGIERGIRAALPGAGGEDVRHLLDVWTTHVESEQERIRAGERPFAGSTALTREAAARVAAEAGVDDPAQVRLLARAGEELDPWADSAPALARIASSFPVVALSNASRRALTRIDARAGLSWHRVLSADDVAAYKPDPRTYRLAAESVGCGPGRLLMVAAHAWDLRGAQAVGMRTAYVERPVGDPPASADRFDLRAPSLAALADVLVPS
ncbi:haloacid dehalogenase type II [Kineococcus sp. G2]|uniref:haloacid dehalogenase type II n=1 Tax=Kineococcus sp. G2 TaxID=3127484 RepID=UPI00301CD565